MGFNGSEKALIAWNAGKRYPSSKQRRLDLWLMVILFWLLICVVGALTSKLMFLLSFPRVNESDTAVAILAGGSASHEWSVKSFARKLIGDGIHQVDSASVEHPDIGGHHIPYGNRCATGDSGHGPRGVNGFKYYLGAVIVNRVFDDDLFHLTTYDCKQWIEYMFYAGVEHIYWYDSAHNYNESQEAGLSKYIELGLITYHRFHQLFPGSLVRGYHFEQDETYRHFLDKYRGDVKWVAELDVDEYPFSPKDRNPCFLSTIIQEFEQNHPRVSQILMQCMFFLGNPSGDLQNGWLIEKFQRRKHETEGKTAGFFSRQKPIFRPNLSWGVTTRDPHMFRMREGDTFVEEADRLRMNHYWGSRITNFGPDTPQVQEMVELDNSIQPIADALKEETGLVSKI